MDRDALVHALAAMDDDEFTDAVRDARGDADASLTPQEKAVAALRQHRGVGRRTKATKQQAADGFRRAATGRD